jgi:hypothetical protein
MKSRKNISADPMPNKLTTTRRPVPAPFLKRRIYLIRGQKVMLDSDLAEIYQVLTKNLNKAVTRNRGRFPADFRFQLTREEARPLRFQIGTSKGARGGRRYLPYAFTELGVAMLSSVLNSERAVQMNILIMRAFVKLREVLASHQALARKIEKLEATQQDHADVLGIVIKDIQAMGKHVVNEFRKLKSPRRCKARIGFRIPDLG